MSRSASDKAKQPRREKPFHPTLRTSNVLFFCMREGEQQTIGMRYRKRFRKFPLPLILAANVNVLNSTSGDRTDSGQAKRQTLKQTETDGQTDGQTDRQTDGRTDRQTDRQTDRIDRKQEDRKQEGSQ